MSFMKAELTSKMKWYQVEDKTGTIFYPGNYFSKDWVKIEHPNSQVTTVIGYGARLSAPGYLDATDWNVYTSREEAEAYLSQLEGDE